MTDSTTDPIEPGTIRLISYARINLSTTVKEGWRYESTVAVTAEYDEAISGKALIVIEKELASLQGIASTNGEAEVRIRNQDATLPPDKVAKDLRNEVKEVSV